MIHKHIIKIVLIMSVFLLSSCAKSQKNKTIRLMTYNLENYCEKAQNESHRDDDFRLIFEKIGPDIIVAQEIWGAYNGSENFLQNVLNHNEQIYSAAFIDQSTDHKEGDIWQDIGVYYKSQDFELLSSKEIEIASGYLRDALEVRLVYHPLTDTLTIIGVHLDAGRKDADSRFVSAQKLRTYCNKFESDEHFIIAGDFNVYSSQEKAWQELTAQQEDNSGRIFDPLDRIGEWHNNIEFKDVHTQATRQDYGGMDDRFDFIMVSSALKADNRINYIDSSYTIFGNDGNHFNNSINAGENKTVSDRLADALFTASDHLPVYADLQIVAPNTVQKDPVKATEFALLKNYPNPFNAMTNISYSLPEAGHVKIDILNIYGKMVANLTNRYHPQGKTTLTWTGKDENHNKLSSGIYFCRLKTSQICAVKKMILIK